MDRDTKPAVLPAPSQRRVLLTGYMIYMTQKTYGTAAVGAAYQPRPTLLPCRDERRDPPRRWCVPPPLFAVGKPLLRRGSGLPAATDIPITPGLNPFAVGKPLLQRSTATVVCPITVVRGWETFPKHWDGESGWNNGLCVERPSHVSPGFFSEDFSAVETGPDFPWGYSLPPCR